MIIEWLTRTSEVPNMWLAFFTVLCGGAYAVGIFCMIDARKDLEQATAMHDETIAALRGEAK